MIVNFDSYIKSTNQKTLAVGSFLAIGLPLLLSPVIGLASIGVTIIGISKLLDYLSVKKLIKIDRQFNELNISSYQDVFNNYLQTYLEKSDTDETGNIEKKYKLLFVKIWLESKHLKFEEVTKPINKLLEQSCFTICGNSFNLHLFLCNSEMASLNYKEFFKEDINNPESLNVIKKVYNDFISLGLLGQNITQYSRDKLSLLAIAQEYQLTAQDNEYIKKYNSKQIKPFNLLLTKQEMPTMERIINCSDKNSLENLELFFQNDNFSNITQEDVEELGSLTSKKIFYLKLKDNVKSDNASSTKRHKI